MHCFVYHRLHLRLFTLNYSVVLGGGFALHGLHLRLFLLNYFVVRVGVLLCFPQIASVAIHVGELRRPGLWIVIDLETLLCILV